ncbi:hypothetical protein NQ317_011632 [Molorchus minor]|uniref:Ig-like domain-containing protein n=1 Tax=Molorchus minor TaxID=1323400 RepID=A0ABQ9J488_9CUCU|nr:hypothetical protein NQ317_011632 [Molorchus minor]
MKFLPLPQTMAMCVVYCRDELYFTKSPKDVTVVLGQAITIPCEVIPSEGIKYYWELNGSKITNTTRRYQQGSNLHITRVDRERDSGQFTCIAEDTTGQSTPITSSPASVNIQCEYIFGLSTRKFDYRP